MNKKLSLSSRILLVDDFQSVRLTLKGCLKQLGYQNIEEVVDGAKAFVKLGDAYDHGRPFELIFSDINMPEIDGMELLRLVRMDSRFQRVLFVLVTAEADRQHVGRAVLHHVNGYIIKPFNAETIAQKLAELADPAGR